MVFFMESYHGGSGQGITTGLSWRCGKADLGAILRLQLSSGARLANNFGFTEIMSSPEIKKYFALSEGQISAMTLAIRPLRGASAVVTDVGRVAVDAKVP